jgi:p-hydroxybenzoate 3-monooxygenase
MNIAIQDAVELASGLTERYGQPGDGRRLASYTRTRLPRVWRHQEFSNLMLSLFNACTADGGSGFSYGLRRARLDLIVSDSPYSRWFAHAYAGVDDQD